MKVIPVTLTLDTLVYAAGDVLGDTAELPSFGVPIHLRSVVVIDEDDQGAALDLVFLAANKSLGVKNAAPTITDVNARDVLGHVSIVAGDYVDLGGVRVATKSGLSLVLERAAAGGNIYVGSVTRGVPTHSVNGLKLLFGVTLK